MEISALQENPMEAKAIEATSPKKKRVSWEYFQMEYLTREDEYIYEWLDGKIEKTKRTMNFDQFYIIINLQTFLSKLITEGRATGAIVQEGDIFFGEDRKHHRKPDGAWFSAEQIYQTANKNNQVPQFVIEVISDNDGINRFNKKMIDYRAAGVKVVWKIHPITKEIHVYSGANLTRVEVCFEEDICSAAPVLPDFTLSVNDVFAMPAKPEKKKK